MKLRCLVIAFCLSWSLAATADEEASTPSLYERLGGNAGLNAIVSNTLERHLANPVVAPYFAHLDHDWFQQAIVTFFAAGTGGPNQYTGQDVASAHRHLLISNEVFDSAMADIHASMQDVGIDAVTHEEVAAILESFRPQVVSQ